MHSHSYCWRYSHFTCQPLSTCRGFLQKVDRWIPRRVSLFRRGHARIFVHGVIDGFNCSLKLCLNKMKSSSKAFLFLCCSQKCWDFQCLNSHANITYVCTLYFGRDAGLPSLENEQSFQHNHTLVALRVSRFTHYTFRYAVMLIYTVCSIHHQGRLQKSNISSYTQMCCLVLALFVNL